MRIQSKTKYECTFVNNETRWKKKTSSPVLIPKQEGPSVAVDENNNKCQVMRNRWEPARGDLSLSLSLSAADEYVDGNVRPEVTANM